MSKPVRYIYPFWGHEHLTAEAFLQKVVSNDFHGIEINMPQEVSIKSALLHAIDRQRAADPDFIFIPQQLTFPENDSVSDYIIGLQKKLKALAAYQPAFINSHTGRDHYSFDDNCRVIEACLDIEAQTGVKILHETHRGRFSYHAASLLPYLEKFPELKLTADISHFCTVSESMLEDQEAILDTIFRHVDYVHARVGHQQAPQVADPFAPEWENHLQRFVGWWDKIYQRHVRAGKMFMMCPEFGPAPYMPSIPFTQQPLGNQWQIIIKMKNFLTQHYTTKATT